MNPIGKTSSGLIVIGWKDGKRKRLCGWQHVKWAPIENVWEAHTTLPFSVPCYLHCLIHWRTVEGGGGSWYWSDRGRWPFPRLPSCEVLNSGLGQATRNGGRYSPQLPGLMAAHFYLCPSKTKLWKLSPKTGTIRLVKQAPCAAVQKSAVSNIDLLRGRSKDVRKFDAASHILAANRCI